MRRDRARLITIKKINQNKEKSSIATTPRFFGDQPPARRLRSCCCQLEQKCANKLLHIAHELGIASE
jgi:hypothetical protein